MTSSFFNVLNSGAKLISSLGVYFKHDVANLVKGEELELHHATLISRMTQLSVNLETFECDALGLTNDIMWRQYSKVPIYNQENDRKCNLEIAKDELEYEMMNTKFQSSFQIQNNKTMLDDTERWMSLG